MHRLIIAPHNESADEAQRLFRLAGDPVAADGHRLGRADEAAAVATRGLVAERSGTRAGSGAMAPG
ncbi:MAG: hypothetical protein ACHQQS_01920 [Thermoanaerobaculales bacterium]